MLQNTFEASFISLDLSEFHSVESEVAKDTSTDLKNGEKRTGISASEKLRNIIAQEMEQKINDNLEDKKVEEQARMHAETRRQTVERMRQTQGGQLSEKKPRPSWLEQSHYGKDFLGEGGDMYATLVSMHNGDHNGAKKVCHRSGASKIHRKNMIVKTKLRR